MDNRVIYSKTSKGMNELKGGAKNMSRDDARILTLINGTASIGDLVGMLDAATGKKLPATLESLLHLGLIRVFVNTAWDVRYAQENDSQTMESSDDGAHKFTHALPTIEVTELSAEESVQAWADARRGANILEKRGFYTYGDKTIDINTEIRKESLRVMVVEDDPSLSHLLETLLKHKGYEVQIASNIPDAIVTLNQLALPENGPLPNLVLLDVMLPGLPGKDGFHVLEYIRNHPALRHIAVIMVTSQITDEYVMQGLKSDADGYIFKPFKWQTLYECIQNVTGR